MRKLKTIGLNRAGLKTFYETNIRSLLIYGAPAWYSLLSQQCKDKLESVQRTATRIMLPDLEYTDRLDILAMPQLNNFIFDLCEKHFRKIRENPSHPLFNRIIVNTCRTSSRTTGANIFRPAIYRTHKRARSFFQFFMCHSNNNHIYVQ